MREDRELLSGEPLQENEIEVLLAAAKGESMNETGEKMHYSSEYVKDLRKRAIRKLDAKNITQAVAIALSTGVLNPDAIEPLD